MNLGYTIDDIINTLTCLEKSDIPFVSDYLIGAPGETPETISETLMLMDRLPKPKAFWTTIGITLRTHYQRMLEDAKKDGQFTDSDNLFNEPTYISPELPVDYLTRLTDLLKTSENCHVNINY